MISFLKRLLWGSDQSFIPHWTPQKATYYERETLRMLGRGETAYAWSKRFQKRKPVLTLAERKRA